MKTLKNYTLSILCILLSLSLVAGIATKLISAEAQEEEVTPISAPAETEPTYAVSIGPAFANISVGEKYTLTVTNKSLQTVTIAVSPLAFIIDSKEKKIVPAETSDSINPADFVSVSEPQFDIPANSSKDVVIEYKKEKGDYLFGVVAERKASSGGTLNLASRIASVIIDTKLTDLDKKGIKTKLEVTPKSGISFLNLNLGKKLKTKTTISNNSAKILRMPGGDISSVLGDAHVDTYVLTPELTESLYPDHEISINGELHDNRAFWKRLGMYEYKQNIVINDQPFVVTQKMFSLPWEVLSLQLIALAIIFVVSFFIMKRRAAAAKSGLRKAKIK